MPGCSPRQNDDRPERQIWRGRDLPVDSADLRFVDDDEVTMDARTADDGFGARNMTRKTNLPFHPVDADGYSTLPAGKPELPRRRVDRSTSLL
jgi:hypothetical protein